MSDEKEGEIMAYPRAVIEEVKAAILKETQGMRAGNAAAVVTGRRFDIEMPDRCINVVFYPADSDNAPLIIGFHGGGFLFGGNALNDGMWSETGGVLGAAVASIEYRKSPDYQYMAAIEDAYDALSYLYNNAGEYGIDRNRISVMGCSAGANLAAAVCLYAREKGGPAIDKQILMYPFLDCDTDPDSKGEGSLSGPVMYIFNELHCLPEETRLPLVSPVFATQEELKGLPDAIICYAENDNLRNEGIVYAGMLRDAGVKVSDMTAAGMPHGFYESGFGPLSKEDEQFLGEEVKRMILDGTIARSSQECLQFVKDNY